MLDRIVDDWAEILYTIIPLARLYDIYVTAYRSHKPGHTMECAELLVAWYKEQATGAPIATYAQRCILCQAHDDDSSISPCQFHQVEKHSAWLETNNKKMITRLHVPPPTEIMLEDAGPPNDFVDRSLALMLDEVNTCQECLVPLDPDYLSKLFLVGLYQPCPRCQRLTKIIPDTETLSLEE